MYPFTALFILLLSQLVELHVTPYLYQMAAVQSHGAGFAVIDAYRIIRAFEAVPVRVGLAGFDETDPIAVNIPAHLLKQLRALSIELEFAERDLYPSYAAPDVVKICQLTMKAFRARQRPPRNGWVPVVQTPKGRVSAAMAAKAQQEPNGF